MKDKPLVTVFIPYYNDEKYLKDAIEAVLSQTYENFELFLFNHASTDKSRIIAHSFSDARIKHIDAEENLGAGSGYNIRRTLPFMQGKYLKLLCADDVLKPNGLESLVECLEANEDKDIVFSNMDYVDEDLVSLDTTWEENIPKCDFCSNEKETLLKFFKGYSHIAYPAAMIKLDAIKDININGTFIMLFDVSLWVRLLIKDKKIIFLPESTVDYRISNNQMSSVHNSAKASRIGYFELFQLLNIYYEIKDVKLIKYLCPCVYSKFLKPGDEEFIPFVLSYFFASIVKYGRCDYFKDQQSVRETFGLTKLYEILQDPELSAKIQDRFGFGIKEFRELYAFLPTVQEVKKINIKEHIYLKTPKSLSIMQLLFLLMRRVLNAINLPHQIKKRIKYQDSNGIKKAYTV